MTTRRAFLKILSALPAFPLAGKVAIRQSAAAEPKTIEIPKDSEVSVSSARIECFSGHQPADPDTVDATEQLFTLKLPDLSQIT